MAATLATGHVLGRPTGAPKHTASHVCPGANHMQLLDDPLAAQLFPTDVVERARQFSEVRLR